MDPINNLKTEEPQPARIQVTQQQVAASDSTPMPPTEMQGGLPAQPIQPTLEPQAPTVDPNFGRINSIPQAGGPGVVQPELGGLGPTVQQNIDTFVRPGVENYIQQQRGLDQRIERGVQTATQENIYPNIYAPPNYSQMLDDFVGDATWQNNILQQQLRDNDAQSTSNAEFAARALETLRNAPQNSSAGDAFGWVKEFLGLAEEGGRQYITPFQGTFSQGNARWNIPATFLYGLGLAQNTVMGGAIDLRNLTATAYNALAPWVRQQPQWMREFIGGKEGSSERAAIRAVAGWLNSSTNKRYNDGRSNTIEALRGAQYSFTDDGGAGLGIKQNSGFRVGAQAGKGWGFDVNPSVLLGFGLDVLVGAKVDKALGPLLPKRLAKLQSTEGTNRTASREGLQQASKEAQYLQAFPEVGKYKPKPKPTGKPVNYEQLELPFTPQAAKPSAKPPKLTPEQRKAQVAFNKANRVEAKRIAKMQEAARADIAKSRKPIQLSLLDDLPQAAPTQTNRMQLPPTVKITPVGGAKRIQLDLLALKEQRQTLAASTLPMTPLQLAKRTLSEIPSFSDWQRLQETPLAQAVGTIDSQTPLARALAQLPAETPLAQALAQLPPQTPLAQVLEVLPDASPLERALRQLPNDTPLDQAMRYLSDPPLTPADEALRQLMLDSPHIDVGGIKVTTAPQRFTDSIRRLKMLERAGTGQTGSAALDELATRVGVQSIDEASFMLDDLLKLGPMDSNAIRDTLDDLPGVLTNSASAQRLADVANSTAKNQVLNRLAASADDALRQADEAIDFTPDVGRKFVGEIEPTTVPIQVNAVDRFGKEIPTKYELPLAEVPKASYHGTRVKQHLLFATDPVEGAARSELGTAHYLSTTKSGATVAARADSARNLPEVATREFDSPTLIEANISPTAKLIDGNKPVGELALLASRVGANNPDLVGAFNGKMSLVQVYDKASELLPEAQALEFQRRMATALRDLGYDGVRSGKIVGVYNPAVIEQGATTAVREVSGLGQQAARAALEGEAVTETASTFAKAAKADADFGVATKYADEIEQLLAEQATDTAEVVGRSGLWDDPVVEQLDEMLPPRANEVLSPQAFEEALAPLEKEYDQLLFSDKPDLKRLTELEEKMAELYKKSPCEM